MKVVMIPGLEAALKALAAAQVIGEGSENGSSVRIGLWFHGTEEAICGHAVRAFALCAVRARPEADGWNAFALELRGLGVDDAIAYRAHGGWPVGVRPCGCAWCVVGVRRDARTNGGRMAWAGIVRFALCGLACAWSNGGVIAEHGICPVGHGARRNGCALVVRLFLTGV